MSPVLQNGSLYKQNGNVTPFVPGDLTYLDRRQSSGFNCDENGRLSPPMPNSTCIDFVSAREGTKWRLRKIQNGTVGTIFAISKNGSLTERARFAANAQLMWASPEAKQYALAKGYRFDSGSNTMVATNAGPAITPRNIDCKSSSLNINERAACINRGEGGMSAPTTAQGRPAPTTPVSQAADCSKVSGFLRVKCEAMAAVGK